MLKEGSKVKIKYEVVEKNFREQLKNNSSPIMQFVDIDQQVINELNSIKEFDKEHGDIRKIKSISIAGRFTKNETKRYTLDNEFVFYKDELIEVEE